MTSNRFLTCKVPLRFVARTCLDEQCAVILSAYSPYVLLWTHVRARLYVVIEYMLTCGGVVLHTPRYVSERSYLLLTVICAQSATLRPDNRFDPGLSIRLLNHARTLAHQVISEGYRSIEICQAFMSYCKAILPSLLRGIACLSSFITGPWLSPARLTEDRTWSYIS